MQNKENTTFLAFLCLFSSISLSFSSISLSSGGFAPNPLASGSWGLRPRTPLASGGWELSPQTPQTAPNCEFLATRLNTVNWI